MWSIQKTLNQLMVAVLLEGDSQKLYDLEAALRRAKPYFLSLFKNAPRNNADRETVRRATREALTISGVSQKITLSSEYVEEALILSDLFDLNELRAVELLLNAEGQLPSYPELTRGLVAVLLYWDARRCAANSLRMLVRASPASTCSMRSGGGDELLRVVEEFMTSLWREGLFARLLELVFTLDYNAEVEKLDKMRALGRERHRRQFLGIFRETRDLLAESVLLRTCQHSPDRADALLLLGQLRARLSHMSNSSGAAEVYLVGALLFTLNVGLPDDVESENEQLEEIVQEVLKNGGSVLLAIHKELFSEEPLHWAVPQLAALAQLAWAQALRKLSVLIGANCGEYSAAEEDALAGVLQQYEELVESALSGGALDAFCWLTRSLASIGCASLELLMRRAHGLLADFISQMPLRVQDLRQRSDELARVAHQHASQGLEPPTCVAPQRRHFQQLLELIAILHSRDPLRLSLANDFWAAAIAESGGCLTGIGSAMRPSATKVALFKFVRMAGDHLLYPSQYIPYLRLLTGLAGSGRASAQACFALLRAHSSSVSWEHFFNSFRHYLLALRQETVLNLSGTTQYRAAAGGDADSSGRPLFGGVSPVELEGLLAVVELIRVVARRSAEVRSTLCDNCAWQPVSLFLGLISCAVPLSFKAALLRALAALGNGVDLAVSLWQAMDAAQLLPNVASFMRSSGGIMKEAHRHPHYHQQLTGIHVELDETEPKAEEYSETLALLELLAILTKHRRVSSPNLLSWVRCIVELVFQKHSMRAYRLPHQKWQVASACLRFFCNILRNHTISDYADPGNAANWLLGQLLDDAPLLRQVLFVLDDSLRRLDRWLPTSDSVYLVTNVECEALKLSLLLALRFLCHSSQHDSEYVDTTRSGRPLAQLLMGINTRTGRADHLVNVMRAAALIEEVPRAARAALHLLVKIISQARPHRDLLTIVTADSATRVDVLRAMVDCMETESAADKVALAVLSQDERYFLCGSELFPSSILPLTAPMCDYEPTNAFTDTEEDEEEMDRYDDAIVPSARTSVLLLLLKCLDKSSPNLAHFLLGFRIDGAMSKSLLQEAGVAGQPKTCLHSLLAMLGRLEMVSDAKLETEQFDLALACQIVCRLARAADTSDLLLRYLRSSNRNLLDSSILTFLAKHGFGQPLVHYQKAWLLQTLAIELRTATLSRQRAYLRRFVVALVGTHNDVGTIETIYQQDTSCTSTDLLLTLLSELRSASKHMLDNDQEPLHLQHLNMEQLESLVVQCEEVSSMGARLTSLEQLDAVCLKMLEPILVRGGLTAANVQREAIAVLRRAAQSNSERVREHSALCLLDGWRQLTEVLLTSAFDTDVLHVERRRGVCIALLNHLLIQLGECLPSNTCMALPLSRTAFILVTSLTHQFLESDVHMDVDMEMEKMHVSLVDSLHQYDEESFTNGVKTHNASKMYDQLQLLLELLMRALLHHRGNSQRVRVHIYGSLCYLLHMTTRSNARLARRALKLVEEMMGGHGEALWSMVVRDATDGAPVTRMLALGALDALVQLERRGGAPPDLLDFLLRGGHLQLLVEALPLSSSVLETTLVPQPTSLATIFLYESQTALLCRLAAGFAGARALLQCGLLSRLADMAVISSRPPPTITVSSALQDLAPPVIERYRQILLPTLRLASTLLVVLGTENAQASQQAGYFLQQHWEALRPAMWLAAASLKTARGLEEACHIARLLRLAGRGRLAGAQLDGAWLRMQNTAVALLPAASEMLSAVGNIRSSTVSLAETKDSEVQRRLTAQLMAELASCAVSIADCVDCVDVVPILRRTVAAYSVIQRRLSVYSGQLNDVVAMSLVELQNLSTHLLAHEERNCTAEQLLPRVRNSLCNWVGALRVEQLHLRSACEQVLYLVWHQATIIKETSHVQEQRRAEIRELLTEDFLAMLRAIYSQEAASSVDDNEVVEHRKASITYTEAIVRRLQRVALGSALAENK